MSNAHLPCLLKCRLSFIVDISGPNVFVMGPGDNRRQNCFSVTATLVNFVATASGPRGTKLCCWLDLPARRLLETQLNPKPQVGSEGLWFQWAWMPGAYSNYGFHRTWLRAGTMPYVETLPAPGTLCALPAQKRQGGQQLGCRPAAAAAGALAHFSIIVSCAVPPHAPHCRQQFPLRVEPSVVLVAGAIQ